MSGTEIQQEGTASAKAIGRCLRSGNSPRGRGSLGGGRGSGDGVGGHHGLGVLFPMWGLWSLTKPPAEGRALPGGAEITKLQPLPAPPRCTGSPGPPSGDSDPTTQQGRWEGPEPPAPVWSPGCTCRPAPPLQAASVLHRRGDWPCSSSPRLSPEGLLHTPD